MALFELASASYFGCSQLVACVDRSLCPEDLDALIRNLGWVGFELTTLDRWVMHRGEDIDISDWWLFMTVEV